MKHVWMLLFFLATGLLAYATGEWKYLLPLQIGAAEFYLIITS